MVLPLLQYAKLVVHVAFLVADELSIPRGWEKNREAKNPDRGMALATQ